MNRSGIHALLKESGDARLISVDVFDTLLLRRLVSERSRILQGERLFAEYLRTNGTDVPCDDLIQTRLISQKIAFRALDVGHVQGEVRLQDVIARQLYLLGLDETHVEARLQIEVDVEARCLVPNIPFGRFLDACRQDGKRVVATSDTTLPQRAVSDLIRMVYGKDMTDAVYTSADAGATKRDESLFRHVLALENLRPEDAVHFGDDLHADMTCARQAGLHAVHLPRPAHLGPLRRMNGAAAEAIRFGRRPRSIPRPRYTAARDSREFGRLVFGPILAEFSQRIWLYAAAAEQQQQPVLLFCARGGIGIREVFERTIAQLGLPVAAPRENLMVSRLVAARAALVSNNPFLIEELEREFANATHLDVANALGLGPYDLPNAWRAPFKGAPFLSLLFENSAPQVLADIKCQNDLFLQHFAQVSHSADRVILCDTGLYGSTQRLLCTALPELNIETIHLARSNYKGHGEEHFPKVTGLLVERNGYSPLQIQSCVLRFWQLVEALFEPALPSVKTFELTASGEAVANCGDIRRESLGKDIFHPLLIGALDYIDALTPSSGQQVQQDSRQAWHRLKRAITNPSKSDLACLKLAERSVDFGRDKSVPVVRTEPREPSLHGLKSLRQQLWREGWIAEEFPFLKHILLPAIGATQISRGLANNKRITEKP